MHPYIGPTIPTISSSRLRSFGWICTPVPQPVSLCQIGTTDTTDTALQEQVSMQGHLKCDSTLSCYALKIVRSYSETKKSPTMHTFPRPFWQTNTWAHSNEYHRYRGRIVNTCNRIFRPGLSLIKTQGARSSQIEFAPLFGPFLDLASKRFEYNSGFVCIA